LLTEIEPAASVAPSCSRATLAARRDWANSASSRLSIGTRVRPEATARPEATVTYLRATIVTEMEVEVEVSAVHNGSRWWQARRRFVEPGHAHSFGDAWTGL
jgi:hypothetical protein